MEYKDWFVTLLFFGLIFSTIGMGFLGQTGIMIMLIGVDVIVAGMGKLGYLLNQF